MTGFVAALIACFVPLEALANLISFGTLMVFTFVDAGVILLRIAPMGEESQNTVESKEGREKIEICTSENQKRIITLLLIYTFSILGTSFILSNNRSSSSMFPLLLFSTITLICGMLICKTPHSWRRKYPNSSAPMLSSQSSQINSSFECPCFPIIPLGGVAMNAILMGGLPLSSWLLCAAWLALGLGLYFSYGMHHSKIRDEISVSHSDKDQLLKQHNDYMSTEQ